MSVDINGCSGCHLCQYMSVMSVGVCGISICQYNFPAKIFELLFKKTLAAPDLDRWNTGRSKYLDVGKL